MAVDKSLLSGSNSMLLMKLLEEKDMYGYEMIETLRERSMNVFSLKAGDVYKRQVYDSEEERYEYKPRGLEEVEYPCLLYTSFILIRFLIKTEQHRYIG